MNAVMLYRRMALTQLAKDQQIADSREIELKEDHSAKIEQLKKEIEQVKKDHSWEIEQLKKDHKKDQAAQGQRVKLLETEVRKLQEAVAAMGTRKVTFDKSKVTFDKDFDKIVVGKPDSTSQARKRSSTRPVAKQEKHTYEEEDYGEDEPQAKKTRREEEHDE